MTLTVSDGAQRQAAIDPTRSIIVQAPAGSGKTELLIQRFLALLGRVSRPQEILAITFTRKAAGEMRARLLQALEGALEPCPEAAHAALTWTLARQALEQDRRQGWQLLANPALLSIQTIDSFDAGLVRRMPWLSRFGGPTTISEDPERLYRLAADALLTRLDTPGPGQGEVALLLEHLDNRLDRLRDLVIRLLARRDQWLRHVIWDDPDRERLALEQSLGALIEGRLVNLAGAFPQHLLTKLCELARYAAANLEPGEPRPLSRLADLCSMPRPQAEDLPLWQGLADLLLTSAGGWRRRLDRNCGFPPGKQGEAAERKQAMTDLIATLQSIPTLECLLAETRTLPEPAYGAEQWQVLRSLVTLLPLAVAELWQVFQQQGCADFAEIALKALAALGSQRQPSELLLKLDARINHILVDEFQDTSYLQNGLLELLTSGWQGGDGRTLFLVGDPMQSIYRFREAEVGLFLRARRAGIAGLPLVPLTLEANFRSQQGIVQWVNSTFSQVFPALEDVASGAVAYAPATAVKPLLDHPAVQIHSFPTRDDVAEAAAVVAIVQQARAAHPQQTIAILVRSRGHLGEILRALASAGLAYQAQDIDPLEARPVIRDLISLTRALLHPADRLAWLSVLRAPWCGLTLDDLHRLCTIDSLANLPELLADPAVLGLLSQDGQIRAARLQEVLQQGWQRRGRFGLRRLVEGCWLALGGPAALSDAETEDAAQFFELLDRQQSGGDLPALDALEDGLKKLFAAPDTAADGRLQVMTIHKSKGLEFDTVILPGLGRRARQGEQPLLRWLEHPENGLLLAPLPPRDGQSRDAIYDFLGQRLKEKEDLEVCRLLYVAATRAKQRLHLLGHANRKTDGDCTAAPGSLLATLWPALGEPFCAALPVVAEAGQQVPSAPPPPLRRYPGDWRLPVLPAAPLIRSRVQAQASAQVDADLRARVFSGWEAETARHIGTITHNLLERIARQGLDRWPTDRLEGEGEGVRRQLAARGVPQGELIPAAGRVLEALRTSLGSPRGRWLLAAQREAACELPLSGFWQGQLYQAVIDRTFIDEEGRRWIIDYKTSRPLPGQPLKDFLAEEAERYRPQLEAYRALFSSLEPERAHHIGLYFPACDGWIELSRAG